MTFTGRREKASRAETCGGETHRVSFAYVTGDSRNLRMRVPIWIFWWLFPLSLLPPYFAVSRTAAPRVSVAFEPMILAVISLTALESPLDGRFISLPPYLSPLPISRRGTRAPQILVNWRQKTCLFGQPKTVCEFLLSIDWPPTPGEQTTQHLHIGPPSDQWLST